MKRPKKTYLVNEEDLETIDYNEPQEDLFQGECIVKSIYKQTIYLTLKHLKKIKKMH